jgi:membrane protein
MLSMVKDTTTAFMDDEALTRGAAVAFYTVTSIGPVLFIVVAIAGWRSAKLLREGPSPTN